MPAHKKFILIIGGNRCGSTSLFHYLSGHPQIIPSFEKETRFFLDNDYDIARKPSILYDGKMQTYLNFFPKKAVENNQAWYLDSSPDYLYSPGTPERIKEFFKNDAVILIALLRDPIDRFLSWFQYDKQLGNIHQRMHLNEYIKKNLKPDAQRPFNRLKTGCYSYYLYQYLELFADRLFLYRFEQLKTDPNNLMQNIFNKVSLDKYYAVEEVSIHNASRKVKSPMLNKAYIYLRQHYQNYFPTNSSIYKLLKNSSKIYQKINYKTLRKETLNDYDKKVLQEYYKDEYIALQTDKIISL